jgi:uncharacterized protein (UPF0276 family)
MPAFTVTYSPALLELVRRDGLRCDGVEVGPYLSPGEVRCAARELPGWRIEMHASGLGLVPFTRRRLVAYLKVTDSRWISCHVRLLSALELRLGLRLRIFVPLTNPTRRKQGMIDAVRRLKKWAPLPVILENMPCSHARHRLECDPQVTSELLAACGCDLLLDLAHARVGAQRQGISPVEYLNQLPLHKVRQIHLSGPRLRAGYLYDAHDAMEEEDYALLDWALGHSDPEVVTLEYFRERETLRRQVERVKDILNITL